MPDPLHILQKTYGYPTFRGQQAEIIAHVIAGKNAFVLMPTGGGKSLCYQIPSLCRAGTGIVISPLIALMRDQVEALTQLGIRAAALNSAMTGTDAARTKHQLREGQLDLLYIAPERLLMDDFLTLLDESPIALFAIDEAHCVSQWGHDFRPHYTQLSILAERFPHTPRLALTATADTPTRKDILDKLHLHEGRTFIAGFDRPNIHYSVAPKKNPKQQLLHFLARHAGESGIVYCLSRNAVDQTAAWLCEQGLHALPYHAGMDAPARSANQDAFLKGEGVIMVATIAFGMGIDKPDVRFVAHLNLPKSIEAYYQETGRAGRDGLPAEALMLVGLNDVAMQRHFIEDSDAPAEQKRIEHQKLNALLGLSETVRCRRQVLLDYFGDTCPPCNNCDTCDTQPDTFDGSIPAQKALSCAYRTGQRFGVSYLIDVLTGREDERIQRFGHDKLSTFGIGTDYAKPAWQSIFRQLVAQNLLAVDILNHSSLKITPGGFRFLKEKPPLPLRAFTAPLKPARTTSAAAAPTSLTIEPETQALFDALKQKRTELAKSQNLPPYVIFHDKTLREMALRKPQTLEAFATLNGVGESKLQRYGQIFLDVITGYEVEVG